MMKEALEKIISLYAVTYAMLERLPSDEAYVNQLNGQLSSIQRDIIGMLDDFISSQRPGSHFQLGEPLLLFLIDFAIFETDAQQISDLGKVQGYVMSFVQGHATGKTVNDLIKLRLA